MTHLVHICRCERHVDLIPAVPFDQNSETLHDDVLRRPPSDHDVVQDERDGYFFVVHQDLHALEELYGCAVNDDRDSSGTRDTLPHAAFHILADDGERVIHKILYEGKKKTTGYKYFRNERLIHDENKRHLTRII